MTTRKKIDFLINVAFFSVCVILFYLAVKYLLRWLVPFIIAMIISASLQRPSRYIASKTKFNQRICSVVLVTLTLLILGFLIFVAGYQLMQDCFTFLAQAGNYITENLPKYDANTPMMENFIAMLPSNIAEPIQKISGTVSSDVASIVKNVVMSAGSSAASFTTKLPKLLVSFIITIVATFFFSMDYAKIKEFFRMQIPVRHHTTIKEIKNYMVNTVFRMLRSYLIIMCITFTELSIGFIIIGIRYPIIIAGITAIVDILPVLGVGTVLIPWCIICLISGNWVMAIKILILYIIIAVVRNIIEPKIVGNQIGLHPIVTLIAMYIGLQSFGVIGMFLFPLTIILLRRLQATNLIHLWNSKEDILQDETTSPASTDNLDSTKEP